MLSPSHVRMHVWERGAGRTLACGTGACATVVAGVLEGKTERSCQVRRWGGSVAPGRGERAPGNTDEAVIEPSLGCLMEGRMQEAATRCPGRAYWRAVVLQQVAPRPASCMRSARGGQDEGRLWRERAALPGVVKLTAAVALPASTAAAGGPARRPAAH